jgi:scyllo-inositol 2-dehydrogenase (NADP+)
MAKKPSSRSSAAKPTAAPRGVRQVLMVVGGPWHNGEQAGEVLAKLLAERKGWKLTVTRDLDALAALPAGRFAAVVIYTTGFDHDLTAPREQGLVNFVKGGGGLLAVHSAATSFSGSAAYANLLNARFLTHPEFLDVPVQVIDRNHYLTARLPDFTVPDELYILKDFDPSRCTVLARAWWQGKAMPLAYVRPHGAGRVAYLANGHDLRAWNHPEFQKLLVRALEWTAGAERRDRTIRCGLLGYGAGLCMGKGHAGWINATPGLAAVAACDIDPDRAAAARQDFPDLETFTSLDDMLKMKDLDLVVNVTPHHLHAPLTLQCLRSGRHVVSEKPFCITTEEATSILRAARRAKVMVSVFHNRRWDGDFRAIQDLIARGLLGEVYHTESWCGRYGRPGDTWRSDKALAGGTLYDWGSHFIDWNLRLHNKRVSQVTGFFQKRHWHAVSVEDVTHALLRFEGGTVADHQQTFLAAVPKPKWRILGTLGGLVGSWEADHLNLTSYASGVCIEGKTPAKPTYGCTEYYRNVADHLLLGEPLAVTGEQAREGVAVIETAEHSSAIGHSLPLPAEVYEDA